MTVPGPPWRPRGALPPRVDYSLTPIGGEVAAQVSALTRWVEDRLDDVLEARETYDGARQP